MITVGRATGLPNELGTQVNRKWKILGRNKKMKKMDTFLKIAIILSIVVFICTIDDFLSLHDIKKDYVSQSVLQYLEVETSKALPDWTNTRLEWSSITVSYLIRFLFIIIIMIILFTLKKNAQIKELQ